MVPTETKKEKRAKAKSTSRAALLVAAAERTAQDGIEKTSIDDIARSIDATKGMVYYYFKTKREIVLEIWKHSVTLSIDGAAPVLELDGDPRMRLFELGYAHAETMMKDQAFHRVAIECMRRPPLQVSSTAERQLEKEIKARQVEYENMFARVLSDGIEAGQFRPGSLSVYVNSVISLLHAPAHWYNRPKTNVERNRHEIATQMGNMAVSAVCGPVVRNA